MNCHIIYLVAVLTIGLFPQLLSAQEQIKIDGTANSGAVKISIDQQTIPLIIGRRTNPMYRITVERSSTNTTATLDHIVVSLPSLSGKYVKSLSLHRTSGDVFVSPTMLSHFVVDHAQIILPAGSPLHKEQMYFWVCGEIAPDAPVQESISPMVSHIAIGGRSHKFSHTPEFPPFRLGIALRKHRDQGVHTYRIPGLVTSASGALIAVYDIRRNSSVDLQEDIDIGMQLSRDQGETWTAMKIIMDMGEWGDRPQGENGIGDPSILVDRETNTIWVAGIWAHGHPGERNWFASKPGLRPAHTSQLMLTKSTDDGRTWSDPINITQQLKDPTWHLLLQGPGKGITLADGTLVFPAQFKDADEMPHATIMYSQDRGISWQIGTGAKSNTTEAQAVQLADGSIMLNMRDNRGRGDGLGTGARSILITKDLGSTWEEHSTSRAALIEPVCMASLIKHTHKGKDYLLFSNPADTHFRKNMTIKISEDDGITWPAKWHTLLDQGRGRGYSCMTSIDENTIGILYEGSQADLIFQKIAFSDLLRRAE